MKELTYEQALSKAAALCSSSERNSEQIRAKLDTWGVSPDVSERIIEHLKNEKFIDDSRYCRAFCADKLRYNQWGRIKIRQALHLQGIEQTIIEQGLNSLDEKEYAEILDTLINKKKKSLHEESPYTLKQKLMRFAYSHGFEPELIISRISFD